MYRGGSRVDLSRSSPGNFYGPTTPVPSICGARNDYFQNTPVPEDNASLHHKIDQLLSMITSTQQVLVDQQATSERLENKVGKLSDDVSHLTGEIDELKYSVPEANRSASRGKIPSELSVRLRDLQLT